MSSHDQAGNPSQQPERSPQEYLAYQALTHPPRLGQPYGPDLVVGPGGLAADVAAILPVLATSYPTVSADRVETFATPDGGATLRYTANAPTHDLSTGVPDMSGGQVPPVPRLGRSAQVVTAQLTSVCLTSIRVETTQPAPGGVPPISMELTYQYGGEDGSVPLSRQQSIAGPDGSWVVTDVTSLDAAGEPVSGIRPFEADISTTLRNLFPPYNGDVATAVATALRLQSEGVPGVNVSEVDAQGRRALVLQQARNGSLLSYKYIVDQDNRVVFMSLIDEQLIPNGFPRMAREQENPSYSVFTYGDDGSMTRFKVEESFSIEDGVTPVTVLDATRTRMVPHTIEWPAGRLDLQVPETDRHVQAPEVDISQSFRFGRDVVAAHHPDPNNVYCLQGHRLSDKVAVTQTVATTQEGVTQEAPVDEIITRTFTAPWLTDPQTGRQQSLRLTLHWNSTMGDTCEVLGATLVDPA